MVNGINHDVINIVTIGHVDHGKSTLIGRMLYDSGAIKDYRIKEAEEASKKLGKKKIDFAFLMDTFQEEREGGITIDIMHIPFKGKKNEYMFIDCPGHREFIKNMITGSSHADAALLLVSAKENEGIQNQTKEHLWLAKILGIEQIVVVINKMDLIGYKENVYNKILHQVKELLKSIGYDVDKVPFVPVSAMEGDNVYKKSERMRWYIGGTLIDILDGKIELVGEPVDKPLRIIVQDMYSAKGSDAEGKSVIGRVETGVVNVGDELIFKPSNVKCKVSSIKGLHSAVNSAKAGDSIGLFLEGNIDSIRRGDVASHIEDAVNIASSFSAQIYIMQPMKIHVGDIIDIRCGTASVNCKVAKIINLIDPRSGATLGSSDVISIGEAATVEFICDTPIAIEKHSDLQELGRLVILEDGLTKAYGVVVDFKSND